MREDEFREQLRAAVGEVPALKGPNLGRPPASPRMHTGAMAVVAGVLAIALVIALVGSRVILRPQGNIGSGPLPSPVASPTATDSFPCMLPVTTTVEVGNQITSGVGFINVPSGAYFVDPSASVNDLPHPAGYVLTYYSASLERWLPAIPQAVSPDETRYVYVTSSGSSSQLHEVDVPSKADRVLWTYGEDITVLAWDKGGIFVMTVPFSGGVAQIWLIDPASGSASRRPPSDDPTTIPLWALPGSNVGFSPLGRDGYGRTVFRFGSRDPGTKYSVVLVDNVAHTTTTLYSGVMGDAKDFDPDDAVFDAHGIWLSSYDAKRLWLWTASSGLKSFAVSGLPAAGPGVTDAFVSYGPAGACVPGTFTGVRASPVAAPSPTPSPSVPQVDWTPLLSRPLTLPSVTAGAACPVSPQQQLDVHAQNGKNGPDYGFGQGPAYISGQLNWYSAGSQGIVVLVDPAYKSPVLVRIRRIDGGTGTVTVTEMGQDLGDGNVGIPQLAPAPYWGIAFGGVTFSAPGCYGIQLDGAGFSDSAVISVVKGPPPPG